MEDIQFSPEITINARLALQQSNWGKRLFSVLLFCDAYLSLCWRITTTINTRKQKRIRKMGMRKGMEKWKIVVTQCYQDYVFVCEIDSRKCCLGQQRGRSLLITLNRKKRGLVENRRHLQDTPCVLHVKPYATYRYGKIIWRDTTHKLFILHMKSNQMTIVFSFRLLLAL